LTCDGPAYVLMNEGGSRNHWLELELEGTKSNRMGLGARVTLTTREGRVRYSEASTAGSYLSANDARVFFGLGTETSIREVIPFPKTARGTDLMSDAPAAVPDKALRDLGIALRAPGK